VIVLGVDPGTRATGYGLVERAAAGTRALRLVECGVVRPGSGAALAERLAVIYEELSGIISRHRPDALAVEDVFVARNARSALVLGHARGVVLLAATRAGLPVSEYAPRAVKSAVTGTGAATKHQVALMVARMLRLKCPPAPADAADGVAVALAHCLRERTFRRAVVG
jgi:crossover junction endodeoxyribonuclease RuvC